MKSNNLNHLAIIMDGNGRWAKARNIARTDGHRFGAETAKKITQAAIKENIKYLSLYTFSSENWNRPILEVNALMNLLDYYIIKEAQELNEQGVKIIFIGDLTKLNIKLQQSIKDISVLTAGNSVLTLYMAVSYGGRQEIVEACKRLVSQKIKADDITEQLIRKYLYVEDMPDIDLLIRTSGEQRLSNFLLWHLAYSELYYTEKNWPDFSEHDLRIAISDFKNRSRNFGYIKNIVENVV